MKRLLKKLLLPFMEWVERKILWFYSDFNSLSESDKTLTSIRLLLQIQKELKRRALPPTFDSFELDELHTLLKALDIVDKKFNRHTCDMIKNGIPVLETELDSL